MPNTLSDFRSRLNLGGARPNLFEVEIPDWPGAQSESIRDLKILCKGAQLPESTVGLVEVPFRGRTFKVAGDRTFAPWTITVINDVDMTVRNSMEEWMQVIAQYQDGSGEVNPEAYQREAIVRQLSRVSSDVGDNSGGGLSSRSDAGQYRFYGIFPTNVSAIDLSYDSADTIEEFTVEFQVNYWAPAGVSDGGNVG